MAEKKIYSGPILVLALVQLVESVAIGIPASYFPNYITNLGATVASIGLFTSSFMLASAIMSPKMGGLSDTYGRKKLMMAGIFGDVVFGILQGIVPSWTWLLLIRVINGAVSGAAMISVNALLIDIVDPEKRGEASGFVMSMRMVGHQIGPLFGGLIQWIGVSMGLTLLWSFRVPYFVDSILALIALVLVAWKIEEPERASPVPTGMGAMASGGKKVPLSFSFKVMLVYAFANGVGIGFAMPLMVLFYGDKFGLQPIGIGMIISVSGLVGLFASWFAGRLSDKFGRKPLIAAGNVVSRTCGFVLPLTGSVTQAVGVVGLRSVGANVSMPAQRALLADIAPAENRGRYFGIFGTAFTAGMVAGPIFGTYIYGLYRFSTFSLGGLVLPGYGIPFFINSILGFLATIMLLIWVKETKTRTAPSGLGPHSHPH